MREHKFLNRYNLIIHVLVAIIHFHGIMEMIKSWQNYLILLYLHHMVRKKIDKGKYIIVLLYLI